MAGNVVPDPATVTLNRRFAPDRTEAEAADEVRALLAPVLEDGDEVTLVDSAPAAAPGLDNPILRSLVDVTSSPSPPSWAGPTSPASPPSACPPATSAPATRPSPTPPTSASTAPSLDRAYAVLHAVLTTPPA